MSFASSDALAWLILFVLFRSASENLLKIFRLNLFAFIEEFLFHSKKIIFFFFSVSVALWKKGKYDNNMSDIFFSVQCLTMPRKVSHYMKSYVEDYRLHVIVYCTTIYSLLNELITTKEQTIFGRKQIVKSSHFKCNHP